jgi:hypothetical protein
MPLISQLFCFLTATRRTFDVASPLHRAVPDGALADSPGGFRNRSRPQIFSRAPFDRASFIFIRRESGATVTSRCTRNFSSKKSGSGRCYYTPQNLTRPDLYWRSAMASTPDCRVASASLSAPAGFSGFPVSSEPALTSSSTPDLSLAADELLQRQLDELAAIHRRLRRLQAAWPAAGPADVQRPANGDFLLYPAVWRFRAALPALVGACGALVHTTRARLDRVRPGLARLRGLSRAGRAGGGS